MEKGKMLTKELSKSFVTLYNYHKSIVDLAFCYFLDGDKTCDECMEISRRIIKGENND